MIITALVTQILRTAAFFNLTRTITEDQAIETGYLLLEKYPYETMEDFIIMFRKAKTGAFGELYNRLDGQVIFGWMGQYLEEKAAYREKEHSKVKFSQPEDLTRIIAEKTGEQNPVGFKTVADALKEAIDFKELEDKENQFNEYKKDYLNTKKNILVEKP